MPQITATITIEDEDASDLFAALLEMEVEEDHRLATMFRIKVSIHRDDEGAWTFLDDERIRLWKRVTIAATTSDEETELVSGYITQLVPHLEPDENQCWLEIHGLDTTCLMSLEEKIKDWPNKTDSDIAREIFQQGYNLTPEVEDIDVV